MGVLRRTHLLAALLGVLGFALLLPGPASPMQRRGRHSHGDYERARARTARQSLRLHDHVHLQRWIVGDHTPDYSVTDALPAQSASSARA